jgi:hypothetical protein
MSYHLVTFEGRSKDLGKRAVEAVMALQEALAIQKKTVDVMEATLEEGLDNYDGDVTEFMVLLEEARAKASRIRETFRRKKMALGVDGRLNLQRLTNNAFLHLRMNAHALKKRVRDRLRQRKFELEHLERAYRRTSNGKSIYCRLSSMLIYYRTKTTAPSCRPHQTQGTRHSPAFQDITTCVIKFVNSSKTERHL